MWKCGWRNFKTCPEFNFFSRVVVQIVDWLLPAAEGICGLGILSLEEYSGWTEFSWGGNQTFGFSIFYGVYPEPCLRALSLVVYALGNLFNLHLNTLYSPLHRSLALPLDILTAPRDILKHVTRMSSHTFPGLLSCTGFSISHSHCPLVNSCPRFLNKQHDLVYNIFFTSCFPVSTAQDCSPSLQSPQFAISNTYSYCN